MATPTKRTKRAPKRKPRKPQLRTSERSTFKACAWQWDNTYNAKQKPIEEAPALRFGTLVHAALEARYPPGIKRGPHPGPVFEKLFDADLREAEKSWGFRDADGSWGDAKHLGVSMLEHYVDVYGRDEEWKVLASELTFQVPVFAMPADGEAAELGHVWVPCGPDDGGVHLFDYVGTMDGVWQNRMSGGVLVNDYKTTKGDPTKEALGKLVLDEQGTAYWTWGVDYLRTQGVLKPKDLQRLDGMLYTFLRKAKKDERPQNAQGQYLNQPTKAQREAGEPGDVSKSQPPPYFHRELVYRDEAQQARARQRVLDEWTDMQAMRQGEAAVYKSPGLGFPHQQCMGCPVFDLCELHEIGEDYTDLAASTMREWDPYAAHEITEEGKR